jgi:bifunctional DNA-binding transcriptional regulator/antitoxin component of YhaV-PrlF toxin-antitoxin module
VGPSDYLPTTERQGVDHQLFHVRVSDGRCLVLPTEVCEQLGVEVGDTVIVDVAEGKVQLHSLGTRLAEFRALVASEVPPGDCLADELLAERPAKAERD